MEFALLYLCPAPDPARPASPRADGRAKMAFRSRPASRDSKRVRPMESAGEPPSPVAQAADFSLQPVRRPRMSIHYRCRFLWPRPAGGFGLLSICT